MARFKTFIFIWGLGFSFMSALWFFIAVPQAMDRLHIQQSGTLGVGKPIRVGTPATTGRGPRSPYRYIEFEYTDNAGNRKSATTSAAYFEEEARIIMQEGKLDIKYNDKGAIQADYKLDAGFYFGTILSSVFGCIGIVSLGFPVFSVVRSRRLKTKGHDVLAKFISFGYAPRARSRNDPKIIGAELCYIKMAYKDPESGEVEFAKTEPIYKLYEMEFFRQRGEFKARCYKSTAAILDDCSGAMEMLLKGNREVVKEEFFKQPPTP